MEIFDWQGISIYQDETVHKVGTDAVLLGSWVSGIVADATSILDAGTGSGILAMMMARCYPAAKVYAVDIDEQALNLAAFNVAQASSGKRVTIAFEDITISPKDTQRRYDLVISNPPFYDTKLLPSSASRAGAKHIKVPVETWIKGLISRLTKKTGNLCIVVPSTAAPLWIRAANEMGYYNRNRLDVFSFADDPSPIRSLLHFIPGLDKPQIEHLTIYSGVHCYAKEYLALTGLRFHARKEGLT